MMSRGRTLSLDATPDVARLRLRTHFRGDEALHRLKGFDKAWWLSALDRARGDLTISLEFA